jgi:hypothetical protein
MVRLSDLTDLKWSKASQGWGKTRVGFSPTGAKLARKDGKAMTDGIGTHSIGSIIYKKLPADIVRFKCTSGLASTDHGGKVRFYVSNQPVTKFARQRKARDCGRSACYPNSAVVLPHVARKALWNECGRCLHPSNWRCQSGGCIDGS